MSFTELGAPGVCPTSYTVIPSAYVHLHREGFHRSSFRGPHAHNPLPLTWPKLTLTSRRGDTISLNPGLLQIPPSLGWGLLSPENDLPWGCAECCQALRPPWANKQISGGKVFQTLVYIKSSGKIVKMQSPGPFLQRFSFHKSGPGPRNLYFKYTSQVISDTGGP